MSKATDFVSKTPYSTAEVLLPSNRSVTLRRPPLRAWALAGIVPSFFSREVQQAWEDAIAGGTRLDTVDFSNDQFRSILKVVRALAEWSFVDPQLREGADGTDGAVCPTLLTEADWTWLFKWFLDGSPEIPVQMENGEEVQIGDLTEFHNGLRW
jgi:hypothetical protein